MASPFSDSSNSVLSCLNNLVLDRDDVFLHDILHEGGSSSSKSTSPLQKCGICKMGSAAMSRCQECVELLCDNCVQLHNKGRVTKNHTIVKLEHESPSLSPHFRTGFSPTGSVYCEIHRTELLKFYCDVCLIPICADCSVKEHRKHVMSYIQDAVEGCRAVNMKLLSDSKTGARAVQESIDLTRRMLDAMHIRAIGVSREIQEFAAKLHVTIKEREYQLLTHLEEIRQRKGRVLMKQIDGLQNALTRFEYTSEQLREALEVGSSMVQLQAKAQAFKDLKYLGAVKVSLQPQEDDFIAFTPPGMELLKAASTFGHVFSSGFSQSSMALSEGLSHAMKNNLSLSNNYNYQKTNTSSMFSASNDLLTNGQEVPCFPGFENNSVAIGEIGDKRELNKMLYPLLQNYRQHKYDNQPISRSRSILGVKFPSNCLYHNRQFSHPNKVRLVFGEEGDSDGQLCRPWGVCCSQEGHIIVADRSNNRIQVFSSNGVFVRKFGKHGSEAGEFDRPAGVAVDPLGNIVVADKDNHRIQVFTKEGHFLFMFGEKGTKNGQFNYPWDVDVNPEGLIVVSDTRNHRIQLFSRDGKFLKKYGFETLQGMWKHFDSPRGVCFGPKGIVISTDFNNHRLVVIESNFLQARFLGNEGTCLKQFLRPQGVAVDGDGHVIVADSRNNRIQVFEPNGSFLCQFGSSGKEPGELDRPSGISLTPDGQIVVVDFGNNRIQLF